jgi:hypothetical protein
MQDDLNGVLESEFGDLAGKRARLLTLIALAEDWLGLARTVPYGERARRCDPAPDLTEEERQHWLTRRRAWIMELRAIAAYLSRRDPRLSHTQRRLSHGG